MSKAYKRLDALKRDNHGFFFKGQEMLQEELRAHFIMVSSLHSYVHYTLRMHFDT